MFHLFTEVFKFTVGNKTKLIFDILDSTPVELNGRVQVLENGDLLISNVRETDAGWYNCIRSNEAGTVTGSAYLGVMGMLHNKFALTIAST